MRTLLSFSTLLLFGAITANAAVDAELLALIPPHTNLVVGIDVVRAQNSLLGRDIMARLSTDDSNFQSFISETGFDPRRDLQSILFTTTSASAGDESGHFAVIARGIYDTNRIRTKAKASGGIVKKYGGADLIVNNPGNADQKALYFPFADVAVVGDLGTVKEIIDSASTGWSGNEGLQEKIDTVSTRNDAWFVSLSGAGILAKHLMDDSSPDAISSGKALQSVLGSTAGIRFGDTVDVAFDAETRSAQDATSLADVIRFGSSVVQMERQQDKRAALLASSLDNMNLKVNGARVHVSLSMPEKDVERMVDFGTRHRQVATAQRSPQAQ